LGPSSFHQFSHQKPEAKTRPCRRTRRCRARRCLLKGCERWFLPTQPQCRYCSRACQQAAERWRRVKASRKYRASACGRARRREQQRHYRQRRRQRVKTTSADVAAARVGKRPASAPENCVEHMCARPGCYVTFLVRLTDSRRRFCSLLCRLALRRVLDREEHYRQRRRRWRRQRLRRRRRGPDTS
jgi:hypothetical protein